MQVDAMRHADQDCAWDNGMQTRDERIRLREEVARRLQEKGIELPQTAAGSQK